MVTVMSLRNLFGTNSEEALYRRAAIQSSTAFDSRAFTLLYLFDGVLVLGSCPYCTHTLSNVETQRVCGMPYLSLY